MPPLTGVGWLEAPPVGCELSIVEMTLLSVTPSLYRLFREVSRDYAACSGVW